MNIHKDDLLREGSLIGEKIGFEKGVVAGISRGRSEGLAQGFSEGSRQKAIETAKLMKYENLGIDLISKVTGLSVEEIKTL